MSEQNQSETPEKENSQHLKDSCNYAISVTKTLLSYSAAGVAFIISIIITGKNFYPNWATWTVIVALAASILLGLLFLMSVVGHINQFKNYNVNLPMLRIITIGQMALFFIPILVLGGFAIWHGTNKKMPNESYIKFKSEKINLKRSLNEQDTLKIIINGEDWEISN